MAVLLSFGLGAAPSDPGCAIMMGLKPHPEMIKGPEAYERFKGMLKAIVAVPRAEVQKQIEKHRKEEAKNPNRRAAASRGQRAEAARVAVLPIRLLAEF